MKNYFLIVLTSLILITLLSCTSVYQLPDELLFLEEKDMDCKHEATYAHNYLEAHGVNSRVVCGVIEWGYAPECHCWIEVYHDNEWKLVDLRAFTEDGWPADQYSDYLPYMIYDNKVTVLDIVRRKNYTWKREGSFKQLIERAEYKNTPGCFEKLYGR